MNRNLLGMTAVSLALLTGVAVAQTIPPTPTVAAAPAATSKMSPTTLSAVPAGSVTVTDWYKQNVYDGAGNKIGDISDVLVSSDGLVTAVIVGVGGFLGMGEKDVAIPFSEIRRGMKDGKPHLTLAVTKGTLTDARGMKYDRASSTWIMADAAKK